MKNKIIILGDSYTFGQGCADRERYYDQDSRKWVGETNLFASGPSEHCWASLAQQDFVNYEFQNLSRPGNSNDNMFRTLVSKIDTNCELVILASSFNDRMLVKDHLSDECFPWSVNGWWEIDSVQPKNYSEAKAQFSKHLYTEKMGQNYAIMGIAAAWAMAVLNQSQFVWSCPNFGDTVSVLPTSMTHLNNLQYTSLNTYQFDKLNVDHNSALANDGHANELGQKLYYEAEIKPMLQKLLK